MSQQLGIILMVDVEAAIKANSLEGNAYLYDNMKLQGSTGLGTSNLVSAIHGGYYSNGEQADEQVLNWLSFAVGSVPTTLPRSYVQSRYELKVIEKMQDFLEQLPETDKKSKSARKKMHEKINHLKSTLKTSGRLFMSSRGEHLDLDDITEEQASSEIGSINPVITKVTGEAVDKKIIYPAAYGSPDTYTRGWYWSASISTHTPGTYAYTMHVQVPKLICKDGKCDAVLVEMTCQSYIQITSDPKVNGFTGAGLGYLPMR